MDVETQSLLDSAHDHRGSIKSVTTTLDEAIIATGGRDGKVFFYDPRQGLGKPLGDFMFSQKKFCPEIKRANTSSAQKPVSQLPQVTGAAFFKQFLLLVVESLSDKITLLDIRKLGSKTSSMVNGQVDNAYYKKTFGDPCASNKGNSSIRVRGHQMLVNSQDNMVNLYDMQDLLSRPPRRFHGHRSSKEFYGKHHITNCLVKAGFGLNDRYIVSGSEDGLVYLWDIKLGALAGTLGSRQSKFGHLNEVNEVATIGNDTVVSASDDMSVIVWSLFQ